MGWQSVMTMCINLHENVVEDLRLLESRLSRQHDQLCIHCIDKMLREVMQRADDTSEAIQVKRFYSGRAEHRKCRPTTEGEDEEEEKTRAQASFNDFSTPHPIASSAANSAMHQSAPLSNPVGASSSSFSSIKTATAACSFAAASEVIALPNQNQIVSKVEVNDDEGDRNNSTPPCVLPFPPLNDNNNHNQRIPDSAETVFYVTNDRQMDFDGLVLPKRSRCFRSVRVRKALFH